MVKISSKFSNPLTLKLSYVCRVSTSTIAYYSRASITNACKNIYVVIPIFFFFD